MIGLRTHISGGAKIVDLKSKKWRKKAVREGEGGKEKEELWRQGGKVRERVRGEGDSK